MWSFITIERTSKLSQLGWDSLEHCRLVNQVGMFYKIYKGHFGISLPAERTLRLPNCASFHQLDTMNDTYKYSFCHSSIFESLDHFNQYFLINFMTILIVALCNIIIYIIRNPSRIVMLF